MKKVLNLSRKQKIISIVLILLAAAAFLIVRGFAGSASAAEEQAIAVKQDLAKYYTFSGNIESSEVQNVTATTNEPVKKFYVEEGDKVNTGDLLYEVDSNTIESTLTTASTTLSNAKTGYASSKLDYERKQELYNMGGISLSELESARDSLTSAQNQVTQAQASYSQAQKQYGDTKRYAEVSGEVAKTYVKENESIIPGTAIMDIVNYDDLEIIVKVDEYDLSAVSEGMEVSVYLESINKTVTGTISEIARGASVTNGVSYFNTTVKLPQDSDLRVGLSAEVKAAAQSVKDAVTVPVAAVLYEGSNAYVQRYDEKGKLQKLPVTVGISNGVDIEIKEGLKEGDSVIYSGKNGAIGTAGAGGATDGNQGGFAPPARQAGGQGQTGGTGGF
ncbi:efflux RND transporter periplasmic adaptor subunit [Anoxybacterium hadale]|uniref:Efflux RND transporter periplasmic adaptor subunit n=1 Tax=Anoxybacterium hadale TaxID=3408580 RepID=A0ACD1AFE8_9FIRM|nr:efflux RND transporter periplasmic adaptor subunit [Clostridiales bacterium]